MKNKTFVVIDGNSVAHRAFHAMPELTNKNGQSVGAVHGFALALLRAVEDFSPDFLAVCFDTKGGTFRNQEFAEYKSQRPQTPAKLIEQLETIQKLLPDLGVAIFALSGFEADDLIASVIKSAQIIPKKQDIDFYILTGDYDSLQLVGKSVKAMIVNRGIKNAVLYDVAKVREVFGVEPGQIPALKALSGDSSDNIPGAPGIGPKAAVEILEKCGSLENAFLQIGSGQSGKDEDCFGKNARAKKLKNILLANKENILRFQKLATMVCGAPLGDVLQKCVFRNFTGDKPRQALFSLGLAGIAKRLPPNGISRNGKLF